jgi:hypothetical protein
MFAAVMWIASRIRTCICVSCWAKSTSISCTERPSATFDAIQPWHNLLPIRAFRRLHVRDRSLEKTWMQPALSKTKGALRARGGGYKNWPAMELHCKSTLDQRAGDEGMNIELLPGIGPATSKELSVALRLALRTGSEEQEIARTEHALHLIESSQFNPAGVLVAREEGRVTGAVLCQPLAPASG